jgi:hypothetical protein
MRGETPRWEPIIPSFSDPREARLVLGHGDAISATERNSLKPDIIWSN